MGYKDVVQPEAGCYGLPKCEETLDVLIINKTIIQYTMSSFLGEGSTYMFQSLEKSHYTVICWK